ncbi:hypothetical protein DNK47_02660 [Mycoplasma wenyonii]|uniref:Uncharacterized protein n=1 Tax=Mycoplasma wenyonii TaxID=65123 RepID=A0A328PRC8_9MOLU|nr:hypothetical protein DNK47_02660 [Mycoplasma wenyonii]
MGGLISIPWISLKTNDTVTPQTTTISQPKIKTIVKQLPKVAGASVRKGNCEVEKLSKEHEAFLLSQKQGGSFYVEIICDNTSVGAGAGSLPHIWTGLFPAQLLANGESLSIEETFNLETKDASTGDIVKTTFKGKGMKETITGAWETDSISWGEDSITPVSFPDNPEITNKLYLMFH